MQDIFYVLVTVIFALFVLFIAWWLYRSLTREPTATELKDMVWTDEHYELAKSFCRRVRARKNQSKKES